LLNLPIPSCMDGSPILDAFKEEYVKVHPPRYILTSEKERIRKRLHLTRKNIFRE